MMHNNPKSIVIIGPAYPLRGGGISTFNERMAKQFMDQGHQVVMYTFSLQYPSFLFPGKSQYSDEAPPANLNIKVKINSVNPFNWVSVGNEIKKLDVDIVVVRYWLPFMGPCLGTILRKIKKNRKSKIICIADNVIPHEKRFGDKLFTKYFVKPVDAFITMSEKVMQDLRTFTKQKAIQVAHPLYDNFGAIIAQKTAQDYLQINNSKKTILFFGFIRKYKGLDLLIEALALVKKNNTILYQNLQCIIAGEFYEEEQQYKDQIKANELEACIVLKNNFIQDSEVKYYLCATDVVIQPYRNATQSGVTPLAYHFEKPMIVTNVGALASNVPHEKVGLVCDPTADAIAAAITHFYTLNYATLVENIQQEKKKFSWDQFTNTIINLYHDL
jgi:glycosyltransferase involved in cell wall biosynthesis